MQRHAQRDANPDPFEELLRDLPDQTVLEPITAKPMRVRDEGPGTTIQSLRNDIAAAQHELLQVQAAPLPLDRHQEHGRRVCARTACDAVRRRINIEQRSVHCLMVGVGTGSTEPPRGPASAPSSLPG